MTDEQLLLRNTGCAAKRAQQVSRLTWALALLINKSSFRSSNSQVLNSNCKALTDDTCSNVSSAYSEALRTLRKIVTRVWKKEVVPEEWHQGIIIPLYKGKGSKS